MSDHEQLKKLLVPFPESAVGKLPKGGTNISYVGHAAVTKRLLEVDPEWTWEPLAFDENGLPRYDRAGGLWIRLTVCGVTRLGYGDGPDPKQRIGDAIRNAAMRFGVALDLWARENIDETLVSTTDTPEPWRPDLGWGSQAEHDEYMARVKEVGRQFGDQFAAWWKANRLKWPVSVGEAEKINAKLDELRAVQFVQDEFPEAEVVEG